MLCTAPSSISAACAGTRMSGIRPLSKSLTRPAECGRHICVCKCVCVSVCAHTRVCVHVSVWTRAHTCVCVCARTCLVPDQHNFVCLTLLLPLCPMLIPTGRMLQRELNSCLALSRSPAPPQLLICTGCTVQARQRIAVFFPSRAFTPIWMAHWDQPLFSNCPRLMLICSC
jgi:hypothetical protein